jgi:two-component system response regulator FlrC
MDLALQAKLLRVLQEHEVERLGGTKTISLDVRILSTSNRNMKEEVAAGRFREDLYYRLNVFPLQISSLQYRIEDILPICSKLIQKHSTNLGITVSFLSDEAKAKLVQHSWPGNIRELENVIQRALLMCTGNTISANDVLIEEDLLVPSVTEQSSKSNVLPIIKNNDDLPSHGVSDSELNSPSSTLGNDLKNREFDIILETLTELKGSRKLTAERLGISQRTLRYKLAKIRDNGITIPV